MAQVQTANPPVMAPGQTTGRRNALLKGVLPAGVLVLLRLWLTNDLPMLASPDAGHDDGLFVNLADSIANGKWLGPYSQMTLIKGPGYPIFIALNHLLHIPLQLGEQLLYVLFCLLFMRAIKPWPLSHSLRLMLLAILLFNPMSFNGGQLSRAVREGIYPALSGLVLACAIGLLLRSWRPVREIRRWSCGLGLAWGGFWLTREEGLWLVPTVGLILGACLLGIWQTSQDRWRRIMALLAGPVWALAMINAVCLVNLVKYDFYGTVEFRNPAFLSAYGSLTRITPSHFHPRVPVCRDSREQAYNASPAFALLRPYLEGEVGRGWIQASRQATPEYDMAGGWFMWALRDAAGCSEKFATASAAMAFYQRMADEINVACDQGKLSAGPRRSTMMAPFDARYLFPARVAMVKGMWELLVFRHFRPDAGNSVGSDEHIRYFKAVTGSDASPTQSSLRRLPSLRRQIRAWIGLGFQKGGLLVVTGAVALLLVRWRCWWQQREMLVFLVAIAGAILLRLMMLAWIDATSFQAINVLYLSPLYLLVLMFVGIALCGSFPRCRVVML